MKSTDIILAMRAGQDPERLHQLRRQRLERVVVWVVATVFGGFLVLYALCA